jgi:hypothetical protein
VDAARTGPGRASGCRHAQRYSRTWSGSIFPAERPSAPRPEPCSAGPAGCCAVGRSFAAACCGSPNSTRSCGNHGQVSVRTEVPAVPECVRIGSRRAAMARRPAPCRRGRLRCSTGQAAS